MTQESTETMNESNRNMIIAIVLSVVVLFGWQFFIAGPQMQKAAAARPEIAAAAGRSRQSAAWLPTGPRPATTSPAPLPATTTTVPAATGATSLSLPIAPAAIAASRAALPDRHAPALTGSIVEQLTGGRLDDLQLKKYYETVDPTRRRSSPC